MFRFAVNRLFLRLFHEQQRPNWNGMSAARSEKLSASSKPLPVTRAVPTSTTEQLLPSLRHKKALQQLQRTGVAKQPAGGEALSKTFLSFISTRQFRQHAIPQTSVAVHGRGTESNESPTAFPAKTTTGATSASTAGAAASPSTHTTVETSKAEESGGQNSIF